MIGGLRVIDGIDVVATLVPEEDAWQFEAAETRTTETQLRDRPTMRERVKGSIQKRCERDKPKRCESLMNLSSRVTPSKKIFSK